MEDRTLLSTFLVSNLGDSGFGSLRQAILDSNAATGSTNAIDFHISGIGVPVIAPLSSLPAITNPVLIDGFSQPGYSGTPPIEISGGQAGGGDGLTITGPDVNVRGLDVSGFSQGAGIRITGTGATGDWIDGDFLGTDPTGTQADPDDEGVEIDAGAHPGTCVGTDGDGINDAARDGLRSEGDVLAGALIDGSTDGNVVAGNLVGTTVTGDVALDDGTQPLYHYAPLRTFHTVFVSLGGGVVIQGGASDNRIGTDGRSVDDAGEL